MKRAWLYLLGAILFVGLVSASGLIFYYAVVGDERYTTNVWSVLFGWQWLYLGAASAMVLVLAIIKHNWRLMRAALTIIGSLLILLLPAQFIYSNRIYITGDGGPAGPDMSCLVWHKSLISGAYGHHIYSLCTLMSMPSLNKFIIDWSGDAGQTDDSGTYYVTLVMNELIIIGGLALALRQLRPKTKS